MSLKQTSDICVLLMKVWLAKLSETGDDNIMVFSTRVLTGILLGSILLTASVVWSTERPEPALMKSIDTRDCRRVLGGPEGAFYFVNKRSFDVGITNGTAFHLHTVKGDKRLVTSPEGDHYALIAYSSLRPTSLEVTEVRLFDSQGKQHWSRKKPGCNSFVLSDASPIAVGISGAEGLSETRLLFFDSNGNLTDSTTVAYYTKGRFSEDGSFFFAVSGSNGILKFSSAGRQVASYPQGNDYRISEDGMFLGAVTDTALLVYRNDVLLTSLRLEPFTFRDLKFKRDGTALALLLKSELRLVNLPEGASLWQFSPGDSSFLFSNLDADDDFTSFVCGSTNSNGRPEERNSKGLVELLDGQGRPVWSTELSYSDWSTLYPLVKVNRQGSTISLLTAESFQIYSY